MKQKTTSTKGLDVNGCNALNCLNNFSVQKLTLKIKLFPTEEQEHVLIDTMKEAHAVCNAIAGLAWEQRFFNKF